MQYSVHYNNKLRQFYYIITLVSLYIYYIINLKFINIKKIIYFT
jgi:hypothetical protein